MKKHLMAIALLCLWSATATAQQVVNVYSARHYDTDDTIYKQFSAKTGIEVKLLEGDSDSLMARLEREGQRSPADVFVTVDAGRLHQAVQKGLFQHVQSPILNERVPQNLRHPDGLWFGLTKRARVILYSKELVDPKTVDTYDKLADAKWRGKLLVRSSSNVYNQSLVASHVETMGAEAAGKWCQGLVMNMARPPQGGDRDQIRGVATGEGLIALANHYYFARMIESEDSADREAAAKVGIIFPNQSGRGAHVNISGAGVVKHSPNRANAIKFLEHLTTDAAQEIFAAGNFEYPVVAGVKLSPVLEKFGSFKEDKVSAHTFGENMDDAVRLMDKAGWR